MLKWSDMSEGISQFGFSELKLIFILYFLWSYDELPSSTARMELSQSELETVGGFKGQKLGYGEAEVLWALNKTLTDKTISIFFSYLSKVKW